MALPVADPVTFKGVIAPFRSKETIVGDQQQHGFLPGDEKPRPISPSTCRAQASASDRTSKVRVWGGWPFFRICTLHWQGPRFWTVSMSLPKEFRGDAENFLNRSVPKIQIQENYFGEDLTEMACNMVGTGGFEPPTSTVSR